MATLKAPFALDRSLNTTEENSRNIADVLAEGLSHITGRTASEVEYDNTESGLTSDDVQGAIDELSERPTLPSVDVQTAVYEFETYNGGLLSSLKVSLTPNQDLHGYDSPWVGGAGKNKCEQTVDKIKSLNTSGTWNGNAYTWNGITYTILTDDANNVIGYDVDGTATARGWLFISDTDLGNVDAHYNGSSVQGYIRTSDNPAFVDNVYMCFYNCGSKKSYILVDVNVSKSHDKWYPMARLSSVSDPTFEPYSNICPISGHTQVDVDVSDGDTTQEQVTVNLGGTYYSGTLDVVSGVLTVDSAFIASYNGETLPSTWISDRDVYAVGTTPTTGAEVCYKLATPTPIQLSPTMVKALVGENHLSAPLEGQEITESKYKQMFTFDDVIAYIQSLS